MELLKFRPVAVDTVILAIEDKTLEVVLVKIKDGPNLGKWAMPGRLVLADETLDEAAKDIVWQGVSEKEMYLEQVYCFGDLERDKKSRSVSVVYFVLFRQKHDLELKSTDLYDDIKWFPSDKLPEMAFDHEKVLATIKPKLSIKFNDVEFVKSLLPEKFTLAELQKVHEVLSSKEIDKRNFVKKIKSEGLITETNEVRTGKSFRPAKLFIFK